MEEYIAILLLVAPGFLSKSLYDWINSGVKESSEFQRTIIAIVNSIPILGLNLLVIYRYTTIENIDQLLKNVKDIKMLLMYIFLTLVSTIIFTLIWSELHPRLTIKLVNKLRRGKGYSEIEEQRAVWDCMFNNDKENHAISISKNNVEVARGFVKSWSFPQNEEKEILLENKEIMDNNPECFEEEECIYYNLDKEILIKEYSLDKLHSKLDEVKASDSST